MARGRLPAHPVSSVGQTFFIGLSNSDLRATFHLSSGPFGGLYMLATLASAFSLPWPTDAVALRLVRGGLLRARFRRATSPAPWVTTRRRDRKVTWVRHLTARSMPEYSTSEHSMRHREVVLIGLGQMGARYGRRLLDAGLRVTVWNRTLQRTQPLAELGARVAPSASAAIASGPIIICALENSAALGSTLLTPEALENFGPHHMVIDTSTVDPKDSCAASALLSTRGTRYLDAPVSGGTRGAAAGTLTIFVGGKPDDFHEAAPILEILGTPHLLGPTGAGHKAKLANQVIVAVTIGAAAEGLFLAQRAGLDPARLLSAFRGGFADSRILREHGDRMARSDFTPGAANRVFLKDLHAIASMAEKQSTALPLLLHCQRAFSELVASGLGEHDHSSYFEYLSMLNCIR